MDTLPLDRMLDLVGPAVGDHCFGILLDQDCAGYNRPKICQEDRLEMVEHEMVGHMMGELLSVYRLAEPLAACTAHFGVARAEILVDNSRLAGPTQ